MPFEAAVGRNTLQGTPPRPVWVGTRPGGPDMAVKLTWPDGLRAISAKLVDAPPPPC